MRNECLEFDLRHLHSTYIAMRGLSHPISAACCTSAGLVSWATYPWTPIYLFQYILQHGRLHSATSLHLPPIQAEPRPAHNLNIMFNLN